MNCVKYKYLFQKSLARNPLTDINLCLYTPNDTLNAITSNKKLHSWYNYILNKYKPPLKDILLFFPCAANKPWVENITKSKNYLVLYKLLNELKIRNKISLHTISEPLGIIGESDYNIMPVYDNPGLFYWFTAKNGLKWNSEAYNKCIILLGKIIGQFLEKFSQNFQKIIAFVKPKSNHAKMIEFGKNFSRIKIVIGPKKNEIKQYGGIKNRYVWMANKSIQNLFKIYLTG